MCVEFAITNCSYRLLLNLTILFVLKPQAVMQKYKCGKISELYISLSIDAGMKLLIFFITPIVLAILFDILFEA